MGDRLGLATPGHVRAMLAAGRWHRADLRAAVHPRDDAHRAARRSRSWTMRRGAPSRRDGAGMVGADADHLKTTAGHRRCLAAGFTFFTIDPERARGQRGRHGRRRHAAREVRGAAVGRARRLRGERHRSVRRQDLRDRGAPHRGGRGGAAARRGEVRARRRARAPHVPAPRVGRRPGGPSTSRCRSTRRTRRPRRPSTSTSRAR